MKGQLFCFILCCALALCQLCEKKTCHECIMDPNICVWCSAEEFSFDNRCRPSSTNGSWCPSDKIVNTTSDIQPVEVREFSSIFRNVIQLKPQKYRLNVRVGETIPFNFTYKAAENFPVDVYFLMDVSESMTTVKEDLLRQSKNIFDTLKTLTLDVSMGFGTFIDKNMLPFHINISNSNETYSFKHEQGLTDDITAFNLKLNNITFGTNFDAPESGLDGIAQVIACKKRINWREQSRKFLVYITDQGYHSAGDGLTAGLTQPYDGKCYLNDAGFYEMEKEMDYPSVGIINKMVSDEKITVIFVSRSNDESLYFNLMNAVDGSYVANYYEDHVITSTLTEIYQSLTQKIVLRVNLTSQNEKYISIAFEPNCGEKYNDATACTVRKGEEKHFTATITLLQYFGVDQFTLGINPVGLKEDVSLNVNVITSCECDSEMEKNSTKCSYAGDRNCGICECYEDKFGPSCGCLDSHSDCKLNGTDVECSGQGSCICGTCEGHCHYGYRGRYCQINVNNCPRGQQNLLCSGKGDCSNGKCACDAGWSGKACECSESKKDCIENGMECSNRGWCRCGSCSCYEPSKWDVRSNIDSICTQTPCSDSQCHQKQCRQLIPCITCHHESDQCDDVCGGNMTVLKTDIPDELRSNWSACINIGIGFGCYANFSYVYSEKHSSDIVLFVLDEKNCQKSQMMIGVISAVVLILIGLLTLLAWKVLTTIQDRREYQQFLKSAQEMESEQINAVYKAPCTTYLNPAFQHTTDDK